MKWVVVYFEGKRRSCRGGKSEGREAFPGFVETEKSSHPISVIPHNTETIRLVQSGGRAVSLTGLRKGAKH